MRGEPPPNTWQARQRVKGRREWRKAALGVMRIAHKSTAQDTGCSAEIYVKK